MTPNQERKLDDARDSSIRTEEKVDGLLRSYEGLDGRVATIEARHNAEVERVVAEARRSRSELAAGEQHKLATSSARRWDVAKVFIGASGAAILGWVTTHLHSWAGTAWRWLTKETN